MLYEKGGGTFPDNKVILGELKGEPELAKAMKKVSSQYYAHTEESDLKILWQRGRFKWKV